MSRTARTMRASSAAWWAMSAASSGDTALISVTTVLLVEALVQGLALHFRGGVLGATVGQLVGGAGDFRAQLQVIGEALRVELAGLDRRTHRAAGFARVRAVAELALF